MIENGGILVLKKKERREKKKKEKAGNWGILALSPLLYQFPWPYLALAVVTGATNHPSPFVWCK